MQKRLFGTLMLYTLLNTYAMAEELEIQLIDESAKSALFQKDNIQGTIVGCDDNAFKKELACAKKPKDAILSKLPSSKQIEKVDLKNDNEREQIKLQLANILAELNDLKEAQKADRDTIKQLKSVIVSLTPKEKIAQAQLQKNIEKITPKRSRSKRVSLVRKKIKEISRTENFVIIEVQKNESLSTYAEAYYGDNRKYYKIFRANRHILPPSMLLTIGDRLTIPLD